MLVSGSHSCNGRCDPLPAECWWRHLPGLTPAPGCGIDNGIRDARDSLSSRANIAGDLQVDDITAESETIAAGQLRSIIERIERLEEEKKTIADDIKEVYAEAKGNGFDTKALRTIVRLRKQDANERQEQEAMLDLYKAALGME
ncbi:hypothetical protein CSC94_15960 [Zhengella mangrovi]|uniref:UPF0335 protein CSC94_15960 n=1 Tax=Zhengella mangrovi TaxID=1982044 RepID=A0A2G1QKN9_9HYPH|nr:hypothetical protein CSC94_15960 [Zhengella mangrovi]